MTEFKPGSSEADVINNFLGYMKNEYEIKCVWVRHIIRDENYG